MEKELVTSDYFVKKLKLDTNNKLVKKIIQEYDRLDDKCKEKEWAEFSFCALYDILNATYNYTI